VSAFGPWRPSLSRRQRILAIGQWMALAAVFCGHDAALTQAFVLAQFDDVVGLDLALREFGRIAPLQRRRILATAGRLTRPSNR
jgi:hypothetical protein